MKEKRTVRDSIIKGMKYILLLSLIVMVAFFSQEKISLSWIISINIISSIYIIIYHVIYRKEILECKKSKIDKCIAILFAIIAIYVLKVNWNFLGIIYIYIMLNMYFIGLDIFRKIFKKIVRVDFIMTIIELLILNINNIHKKDIFTEVSNKNILILVSRLHTGGAERVAVNLANNFKEKYDKVVVVTYNAKTEDDYECNVKHIQIKNKEIKRINDIKKIKKKYHITHSISFCTTANYLNVASNNGEKVIISVRNYLSNSTEKRRRKLEAKISVRFADKIVAVAKAVEIEQIEKYKISKDKILTINNFYEEAIIEEKAKQKILDEEERKFFDTHDIVITVGRLNYQKGQWYLIRAFKEVIKECPNARLVILGKGEDEEKLKSLIQELQLEKYVKLYGFKENPYQYLSKAKVFVSESLYEGMSNVILEAMKCGLPIIATDCLAGNREILAPNTELIKHTDKIEFAQYGILVPVGDGKEYKTEELNYWEIELKEAIIKILKDKDLREKYIKQSKIRIKDFEKEKIIKQWYDLIEGE